VAAFLFWLNQNWFNLIQTLGILGSIWLTIASLRRETRARKLGDYLTLAGQHRELWSEAHRRPDLARIFQSELDLVAKPISVAEEEFLRLVIVHFSSGWLLARDDFVISLEVIAADVRGFFSLPLPRAIFERARESTDPAFVAFVDQALRSKKRKQSPRKRLSE
jgi:hypothetical protein